MAKKRVVKKPVAKSKAARKKAVRAAPRRAVAKRVVAKKAAAPPAPQTVTPYLCCKGAAAALEFYKKGFGAKEMMRMTGPDGSVGHADIQIHGARIFLSDEYAEMGVVSPTTVGGTAVSIHLYVPDVDAFFKRATAAGATALRAVADMPYGDRTGTLQDPFGHRWQVATKKESVGGPELQERFGSDFKISY